MSNYSSLSCLDRKCSCDHSLRRLLSRLSLLRHTHTSQCRLIRHIPVQSRTRAWRPPARATCTTVCRPRCATCSRWSVCSRRASPYPPAVHRTPTTIDIITPTIPYCVSHIPTSVSFYWLAQSFTSVALKLCRIVQNSYKIQRLQVARVVRNERSTINTIARKVRFR